MFGIPLLEIFIAHGVISLVAFILWLIATAIGDVVSHDTPAIMAVVCCLPMVNCLILLFESLMIVMSSWELAKKHLF